MKYSAVPGFPILFACGCNRNEVMTRLLDEQEFLKDSDSNIKRNETFYFPIFN